MADASWFAAPGRSLASIQRRGSTRSPVDPWFRPGERGQCPFTFCLSDAGLKRIRQVPGFLLERINGFPILGEPLPLGRDRLFDRNRPDEQKSVPEARFDGGRGER